MRSIQGRSNTAVMLLGLLLTFGTGTVSAHAEHEHAQNAHASGAHAGHAPAKGHVEAEPRITFADQPLTDQHGRSVNLEKDLVSGRIVVISFMYTQCTTVCPVVSSIMAKVQDQLGERAGDGVSLVSITIDPLRDTPERLREYAELHKAGPGWSWLTGSVPAITATLKSLRSWSPDLESHQPVFLVGNDATGEWSRFYGFTDPAAIVARVDSLQPGHAETHPAELRAIDSQKVAL